MTELDGLEMDLEGLIASEKLKLAEAKHVVAVTTAKLEAYSKLFDLIERKQNALTKSQ